MKGAKQDWALCKKLSRLFSNPFDLKAFGLVDAKTSRVLCGRSLVSLRLLRLMLSEIESANPSSLVF